jgi:hypothetical protein
VELGFHPLSCHRSAREQRKEAHVNGSLRTEVDDLPRGYAFPALSLSRDRIDGL